MAVPFDGLTAPFKYPFIDGRGLSGGENGLTIFVLAVTKIVSGDF